MTKPLILVSNDDGYQALGVHTLRQALTPLGDVYVVAPTLNQSAKSHSITLNEPLRFEQLDEKSFHVGGSPADCVYVALYCDGFLPRKPDLICSGINHGANVAQDIHYSGTVAAAREGALRGIPAVAFSLLNGGDFDLAGRIAHNIAHNMLQESFEESVLYNVNIPPGAPTEVRPTRLGDRIYDDRVIRREDPRGGEYLWLGGSKAPEHSVEEGSDTHALSNGAVSISQLDLVEGLPSNDPMLQRIARATF